jgi:hypothetical protein
MLNLYPYFRTTGEKKTATQKMTEKKLFENEKKMTMEEKRFSFFADPQERKAESRLTFGTLPFARHTSQRLAKRKSVRYCHSFFLTNCKS